MNANRVSLVAVTLLLMVVANAMDGRSEGAMQTDPLTRQWGSVSQGFQLSAELGKVLTTESGGTIALELTIRNTSNRVLPLTVSSPEKDYQVKVKNGNGDDVPLTEYGEKLRQLAGDHLSRVVIKVAPWQEQRYSYPLGAIYRMTSSGSYSVTARRTVFKLDGKGIAEVSSNEVKITIS